MFLALLPVHTYAPLLLDSMRPWSDEMFGPNILDSGTPMSNAFALPALAFIERLFWNLLLSQAAGQADRRIIYANHSLALDRRPLPSKLCTLVQLGILLSNGQLDHCE